MPPDKAEIKTNREPAECESEDSHLGVGGAGGKKKADETEPGHHQPDNDVTYVAIHLHLSGGGGEQSGGTASA
jgi:hypothetical protein